jgi:hypothetical protein
MNKGAVAEEAVAQGEVVELLELIDAAYKYVACRRSGKPYAAARDALCMAAEALVDAPDEEPTEAP